MQLSLSSSGLKYYDLKSGIGCMYTKTQVYMSIVYKMLGFISHNNVY